MRGFCAKLPTHIQYVVFMTLTLLTAYILMFCRTLGIWESTTNINVYTPQNDHTCTPIYSGDLSGAEHIVRHDNFLFISAAHRRRMYSDKEGAKAFALSRGYELKDTSYSSLFSVLDQDEDRGNIFVADLSAGVTNMKPRALPIRNWNWDVEPDFHPLGMNVFDDGSQTMVRAVVVTRHGTKLVQFRIDRDANRAPTALTHVWTLAHPLFSNLNSVKSLSASVFYVTNMFANSAVNELSLLGEIVGLQTRGNVLKCFVGDVPADAAAAAGFETVVAGGYRSPASLTSATTSSGVPVHCYIAFNNLGQPNGIEILPHRNTLLVAMSAQRMIHGFDLTSHKRLFMVEAGPGLDNLSVDEDGYVWVAAHPRVLDFLKALNEGGAKAPNRIMRLSVVVPPTHPHLTYLGNADVMYEESAPVVMGAMSTAVSIPARYGELTEEGSVWRYFVAGSVVDEGVMVCKYRAKAK